MQNAKLILIIMSYEKRLKQSRNLPHVTCACFPSKHHGGSQQSGGQSATTDTTRNDSSRVTTSMLTAAIFSLIGLQQHSKTQKILRRTITTRQIVNTQRRSKILL